MLSAHRRNLPFRLLNAGEEKKTAILVAMSGTLQGKNADLREGF